MSFVQRFNPETGTYIKIHVATGDVVGEQKQPFPNVDEIEPIEVERPRARMSDPLEVMR
ncbi:hypothetical protein [Mesorhizobium sp. B2-6-7]|uniref:hypothetical protein n=1 Tax=Mesorhizobium sp. B2-6-7 TaxID=2589910 RepID=UPI0015E47C94|nr:hypothetical protein [Mesorhizobium sp. B2-6-7]